MEHILPATNEVYCAVLANSLDTDSSKHLKADPKAFIYQKVNIDLEFMNEVNIVENQDSVVHIALPYYADVDKFGAASITDEEVENTSGGFEFWAITLLIVGGAAAAGGATAAGIATGAVLGNRAQNSK